MEGCSNFPRRSVMRLLFVAVLVLALSSPWKGAKGQSDLDQIRVVIERQLTALRRGRAAEAYRLASDGVRQEFPDAPSFMRMINANYAPLLKHRRATLLDLQATPTGFAHGVRLVDAAGATWNALVTVERRSDGAWAISGCQLIRAPALRAP